MTMPHYGYSDEYIPKSRPQPALPNTPQPHVTVVIISFNTEEHVAGCIQSLLGQDYPNVTIVFIDNNSKDGSAARALQYGHTVKVIANWSNKGFAGAANQGIALADPDGLVFIMNPDIRLRPTHLSEAVRTMLSSPDIASVQGRIYRLDMHETHDDRFVSNNFLHNVEHEHYQAIQDDDGHPIIDTLGHSAHRNRVFRNRHEGEPFDGTFGLQDEDIWGVSGCAALYRVQALHDIAIDGEIFDEDFFAFFEDVDMDWRLKRRGWRARYSAKAIGLHERGGTGARRSAFVERLSYRNWFLLVLKNDDMQALGKDMPLLGATTLLRTADLVITVPLAFIGAIQDTKLLSRILTKRQHIQANAKVTPQAIVEEWFGAFNYKTWITKRLQRSRLARFL